MIGPTFIDELKAAGAQIDGLAWGDDGALSFRADYPDDQRTIVENVLAAHEPNNAAAHNAAIDAQIEALERQYLCPRFVREKMLTEEALAFAASHPGLTQEQVVAALTTPGPDFNPGFTKLFLFDVQIVNLRKLKQPT